MTGTAGAGRFGLWATRSVDEHPRDAHECEDLR
jgi:hypothetical protein